jgi:hypothetical protein
MRCIVNAYIGSTGWYQKGAARLKSSVYKHGAIDLVQYHNHPINDIYDPECHYTIKAAALKSAVDEGYRSLLWADCSMICQQSTDPIFELIEKDGIYCETNGFNAAQECSDKCLNYYGISRDEAENIPMCSSGLIGFDIHLEIGISFYEMFIQAAIDGIFSGSRQHDNQSQDHRFMHHRQDQSAASIILYKLGYKPHELGKYLAYSNGVTDNTIFVCQGM